MFSFFKSNTKTYILQFVRGSIKYLKSEESPFYPGNKSEGGEERREEGGGRREIHKLCTTGQKVIKNFHNISVENLFTSFGTD